MVELAPPFLFSMFGDVKSANARGDLRDSIQARAQVARAHELDLGGSLGSSDVQQMAENYGAGAALMHGESSSSRDSWYRRSVSEKHMQRYPGTERMDRGLFADFSGLEKSATGGASERAHTERLQMVGAVDKADGRVAGVQEVNAWPGTGDDGRGLGYSPTNSSRDFRRTVNRFEVQEFQSFGDAVICTDVKGNITLWNQAAEDLFLYKSDEVMGRDLVYLLSPKHLKTEAQQLMSRVRRGESLARPAYSVRKDGATLDTFVTSNPIVDHLDEVTGIMGIYVDMNSPSTSKGIMRRSQSSEGFVNDIVKETIPPTGSDDGKNILQWKRVQLESDIRSAREPSEGQSSATDSSNFLMMGRTSVKQLLRKLQVGYGKPNKLIAESSEGYDLQGDDLSRNNESYTAAPTGALEFSHNLSPLSVSAGEATTSNFGLKDGVSSAMGHPGKQVEREGGGSWGNIGFSEIKTGAQVGTLNQTSSRSSSGRSLGSACGLDASVLDSPAHSGRSVHGTGINFQRAEEDFQLQLALALRVASEAAAIEDPQLSSRVTGSTGNGRWSSGISHMEATAYRYWVSSCLSYDDRIEDGFYEIWGMSPQVWSMCTDSSELGRMPPLENLRAVSVADASFEVVLIDRSTDPDLFELEDKAVGLAYESSDVLDMASELSIMVSRTMGGPAPSDDALAEAWQESSSKLMQEIDSIVLPIGRLRVGLSRHRALLFKVMADSVGLACRLVRGSAFSNKENDTSVTVKCADDREWMVDLLVHPGSRMPPDKRLPVRPPVIASPLQFGRPNPLAGNNVAHWSRGETRAKDVGSGGDGTTGSAREVDVGLGLGFYTKEDATARGSDKSKGAVGEALKHKSGLVHMYDTGEAKGSSKASSTSSSPVKQMKGGAKGNFFTEELSRSGEQIPKDDTIQAVGPEVVQKVGSEIQQTIESEVQPRVRTEIQWGVEPELQQKVGTEMQQKVHRESQKTGSGKNSRNSVSLQVESAKDFENAWVKEGKEGRQTAGSNESAQSGGPGRIVEQLVSDISDFEIVWGDVDLGERIGQGSYGKVFRGDWQGSDVAVKVFLDQDLRTEALEEFKSEVALMRRLRHPNIVLFMGAVTKPPNLSIITEFCPRGSLYRLLHRPNRELDDRKRIRMALDVAKGMNYLHRCSPPVVHRDLKSPNLLVDKNWTVKVADFGLSRQKHSTFLSSKSSAGTPEWMAPEVLRNEPSDEKSDVYSFGVILWELATLQVPWNGMNPIQVVGAVGFQHRRLVVPDNIDPAIAAIIQACWRPDTKKRPSFAELMQELKSLQQRTLQIQSPQTPPAGARTRTVVADDD